MKLSRRNLLTAGAGAFTIAQPWMVHAAGKERLRAGIVGCGGRGTQAVVDLLTGTENVDLVAMADVFEDHLEGSLAKLRDPAFNTRHAGIVVERNGQPHEMTKQELAAEIPKRVKVDPDHHFVGFDAYKKLINSDLDIVMLTTPPGYRPMHFEAAIEAKKHVFTEKPIATDPVGVRRFMAAAKKAEQLKLTVMSGAQRHEDRPYVETVQKIHDGAIGDIVALYANYLAGPVMHVQSRDAKWGDMEWEHRNWYSFVWICGDQIVEQHIHDIDFINWVMGTHPARVVASGGVAWRPREELYGNIYDHLSSDFTYPNGVHLSSVCRQYPRSQNRAIYMSTNDDMVVGTKGRSTGKDMGQPGISAYVQEHINAVNSIRGNGPYINQGQMMAESTLTCIMARESAYSGQEITWEQAMASQLDLQPKAFDYTMKMDPREVPMPGKYKFI